MADVQVLIDRGSGFEDLSDYATSLSITRGRTDETEPFQTGRASINLRNLDGEFDPAGDELRLRDRVVIYVGTGLYESWSEQTGAWDELDPTLTWVGPKVFTGFIEDVTLGYSLSGDAEALVSCVDGFALLANQQIVDETVSIEDSGARINTTLGNAGVSWPSETSVDTGISVLAAGTATGNALQYMRQIEQSEQGYFFVDRDGTLTFLNRHTALDNPIAGTKFSDDGTGIPYERVERFSGARSLFNKVTGALADGTSKTADNATSQGEFSIRTLDVGTVLLLSPVTLEDLLQYLLTQFEEPATRVDALTVNLERLSQSDANKVASFELADICDVEFTPPGRSLFSNALLVQGISHQVTVGGAWEIGLSFQRRETRAFFILDDGVRGKLDDNPLAF